MSLLPVAVQKRLMYGATSLAWVELKEGRVLDFGGDLEPHGLEELVRGNAVPKEAVWGAAIAADLPLELRSLRLDSSRANRSDLIAWDEGGSTYAIFFDATATAEIVGATLQRGNTDELLRDRLAGAERLRRAERRFRGEAFAALGYELLEQGPDGAFRPPSEPAFWLVALCGWDVGEPKVLAPGDPIDYLTSFLMDAAEFFEAARADALEPRVGTLPSGVWTMSLPETAEPGAPRRDRTFQAHAIAMSDGRGIVVVELMDTSLEEMQSALQRRRDAELSYEGLSHEIQVKDVLLHCIVHDLRGPLASLVGSFSLLEKGGLDANETQELIQMGLRQAKLQEEMIQHVLDVFASEYDALRKFDADPETAPDLVAIAHEAAQRQQAAFRAKGVKCYVSAPAQKMRIVGRADRLERVIANLLGNALRHAPEGSEVEIRVTKTDGAAGANLSVLDRGPGVPDEIRDRLFRRFVQGGSRGAAGLGLFYVRMTVERWGGQVRYEPREGGGAAFVVSLKRATAVPGPPTG